MIKIQTIIVMLLFLFPSFMVNIHVSVEIAQGRYNDMATFGKTAIGGTSLQGGGDVKQGCRFQVSENGVLIQMSVYCKYSIAGNVRTGIYADSSGSPGALLGQSLTDESMPSSYAWVNFNFNPISLEANEYYWLIFQTDSNVDYKGDSDTGRLKWNVDTFSDGLADPFGSPNTANYEVSIYGTYNPIGRSINEFNRACGSGLT